MKTRLLLMLLLLATTAKAQVITFADPTFKAMLVNAGPQNFTAYNNDIPVTVIDTNADGEIQVSEALLIDELYIEGVNANAITNIQGIEGFANLTDLIFTGVSTPTINLTGMPNLTFLSVTSPVLTSATISAMPALVNLGFWSNVQLTAITVSNCGNLQMITAQENPQLATFTVGNLLGLEEVYIADNQITSVNFTGCPNLEYFNADNNQLTTINVAGLAMLADFRFENNPGLTAINASGCSSLNLNGASFNGNNAVETADFSGCSSLQTLAIANNNLNFLSLSGCSALTQLNASNNELTALSTSGCGALLYIDCSQNELMALDLSGSPAIEDIVAFNNVIAVLNLSGCDQLITANFTSNGITALDLSGIASLETLTVSSNPLAQLDLSGCTALSLLNTQNTALVTADFSGCSALTQVNIVSDLLSAINLQGTGALTSILVSGTESQNAPIASLDVSGHLNLEQLICNYTDVNTLNIEGCTALAQLSLFHNPLESLDYSDSPDIVNLNLGYTNLQDIDVTALQGLETLTVSGNPLLEMVFAKNGADEAIFFNNQNTSLTFVCQDDGEIQATQNLLLAQGLSNVEVNTYCSFTPGGDYNTITGLISFDGDNNGCDPGDVLQPNVRIDLADGAQESATFTNPEGQYTFYTGAGSFTLAPVIENEELFSVSPSAATILLSNDNNNETIQNFCITAVGTTSDAEIVIAPIWPAKPGFTAWYQIVIKNKGNQTLSGAVTFTYNEEVLDFEIATQSPDLQADGLLGWDYGNLLPFESRSYYVGLNVNSPVEVPAVNIGDILHFSAAVNPVDGDFTPLDNEFIFDQEVVGSFDPNDITCIEGEDAPADTIGDYLHYVVNFENTGNAAAENIVVRVAFDDTKYDINSLQLLSTSHPSQTVVHGNIAEFIFAGINLEAASDPPVNGHGNVLFKVRTLTSLDIGDTAAKKADIYFDYNAPIVTNLAATTFSILSNPEFEPDTTITLYPNPAKDYINIHCKSTIRSIELFDIQGRIIQTSIEQSDKAVLEISQRSSGMYFVRITTENGTGVFKIIKE